MAFSFFNMQTSFIFKFNSKKAFMHKINMIAMDQMDPAYPSLEVSFLIKMFASNLQLY